MFKDKIAEMECNEDCGRLGLKDFLVKPYQRLTKYPLLMKDIKEALMPYSVEPKKDDKAKRFTQAEKDEELEVLDELEAIGKDNLGTVNQAIADSEDRAKLKEIDEFLKEDAGCLTEAEMEFMDDLHIGRKLELDGEVNVLKKVGGSKKPSKHKVRLMLLTDMLLILEQVGNNKKGLKVYKPFQMPTPGFSPMMMLGAMELKHDARGGGKNGFFVLTTAKFTLDGRQGYPQLLEFDTDTKLMCKKWKEAIERVTKAYKAAHPTWAADLAETAAERRAAKSSTLPTNTSSFKESFKALGRRSSMQSSQNPRANSVSQSARGSSLRIAKGAPGAAAAPASASFEAARSSPLRPGGSIEAATAVDMAEVEAELAEARREIERLKAQNETLTKKLSAAQTGVAGPDDAENAVPLVIQNAQLVEENQLLKAENTKMKGELEEAEHMLFGDPDQAGSPKKQGSLNIGLGAPDANANAGVFRSPSYISGKRAAAPTSAPPPPPPSSASKPPIDLNPFPALPDTSEEYMEVGQHSPERRITTGSFSGFGADFDSSNGQPREDRDSSC